jgi:3-hydroxyacyl-CoA dehydrogenase/enoyl-CoA hydratase/3-hydroxybutyryl-CoA epimerase
VVATDKLFEVAEAIALGTTKTKVPKLSLIDKLLTKSGLGRAIVRGKAAKATQKQTKGFYPAPIQALETTVSGLALDRTSGLKAEAKALGSLIVTPESKALTHIFFLTEAAKSIGKSARKRIERADALIIGAGTMGAGIAGSLARSNHQVIVKDNSDASLERGKAHIAKELSKTRHLSSFERAAIANRIDWIQFTSPTIARTKVVIEAVFENLELKKRIFKDLCGQLADDCILATNTSSLSVTEMATAVNNPERFVGMHFFNPVEKMPLVEIIRGQRTSPETIAYVAALSSELGKFPIVVEDVPGFLVNRILIPYLNEAVFLLQEGYSVEDIDRAATDFGMPMGPLRLLDEVGLDVAAHVSKVMVEGYGERMAAPNFAEQMIGIDRKGRKNGRGFYDYTGKEWRPWSGVSTALKLPSAPAKRLSKEDLQERLILHLVNEAMKCLIEGVAGADTEQAKKQIDLGTVMGIGFPPFRGGVIYYAERRGLETIEAKLGSLSACHGARYTPWTSSEAQSSAC